MRDRPFARLHQLPIASHEQSQWSTEVVKMEPLYDALLADDDVKKSGAYLAVT
ncbi:MAG: hypothetical protein NVSMB6_19370 [Burkholderiaceae bacterium]